MKKPSNKQKIKEILDKANRKFAGRWMASEDMSYIFPVAEVVYTGKPGDAIPSDPEELPLAIQIRTFINDVDNVAWDTETPVEVGQNTRFYENPYAVESGLSGSCIKFITRAEARTFAGKLRKRLAGTLDKLDRVGP